MSSGAALAAARALASAHTPGQAAAQAARAAAAGGISRPALRVAFDVVMALPPGAEDGYGPATVMVAKLNLVRRAQFVLASARRIQDAVAHARSRGQSEISALTRQADDERRYYAQQLATGLARSKAAAAVDSAAMEHGPVLGWYAVVPGCTPECCRAAGHNFQAAKPPAIGYPGMVHPGCKCYPGPPYPRGKLMRVS